MTNKILNTLVSKIRELTTPENENEYCQWTIEKVFEKINELATPIPESQESIFDANGWCEDFTKVPVSEEFLVFYYCPIYDEKYLALAQFDTDLKNTVNIAYLSEDSDNKKLISWFKVPPLPKEA